MPLPTTDDIRLIEVSLCSFTEDNLRGVAARLGVSLGAIRHYLAVGKPNAETDRAIHFVTGMYPAHGLKPSRPDSPTSWERIMAD